MENMLIEYNRRIEMIVTKYERIVLNGVFTTGINNKQNYKTRIQNNR